MRLGVFVHSNSSSGLARSTEILIPETDEENVGTVLMDSGESVVDISDDSLRVINALREGYRLVEKRGHEINEAETRMLLINPVLDALGFPPAHRRPEDGDRGNRPDELCYDREVQPDLGTAAIILEAKALGSDFDVQAQPGRRTSSPDRQIQRYLRQHVASGQSTIGILTDGLRWRIYRRSGLDVALIKDYDFASVARQFWRSLGSFDEEDIAEFDAFVEIATRCYAQPEPLVLVAELDPVIELLKAIVRGASPDEILGHLIPDDEIELRYDIADQVALTALQQDMLENDWEENVYVIGPRTAQEGQLSLSDQLTVGVLKFKHSEWGLGRGDTAMSARIFARAAGSGISVLLVYSTVADGVSEARLAVCADGKVNMTAAFDPDLPAPSARTAIGQIIEVLSKEGVVSADDLMSPLEVAPLRQRFYQEVSQWTWNLQQGQDLAYRQAVLKHLIRVIFTWILKEESIIPPEIFEYAYSANYLDDVEAYHAEMLSFLFHERLNVVDEQRSQHPIEALNEILDQAPFLNGSLFARNGDDIELDVSSELYWNSDEDNPGLFTIFSRYHWTTDEHRPGESEQTLDPELLSNLFEQLITPTEEGRDPPPRQPRGTYYTPADVADEMVKDALTAAVRDYAPSGITDGQLLDIFGDPDTSLPDIDEVAKSKLANRIRELRIFDPAVGSGEFLFSCLIALRTALNKLNGVHANAAREIIKNQLAGQDINALATQVTRLRLFIAIESAEKGNPSHEPLPNLEARIVCADTLETIADPNWQMDRPGSIGDSAPEFAVSLAELARNRKRWFDAHSEEEKSQIRAKDDELRRKLRSYLVENGNETVTSPELKGFVEYPLLSTDLIPARTDPRMLFYEPERVGFDIVIGNPPYERLSRSVDQDQRNRLIDKKGFKTTNVNDLYTLFCEVGLALARQDGGVVTMIVPLSIAFGQRQRTIREIFESRCARIDLRHYDNRPDTTFNLSPTVKSPDNRQRTTIVTAVVGEVAGREIRTSGLQSWRSEERPECLKQRWNTEVPDLSSFDDRQITAQWPRIPTRNVAELIEAVSQQSIRVSSYASEQGRNLAFPRTAYHFISTIPEGAVAPRTETVFTVESDDDLRLIMATLNGHVAYAWWAAFGDGFHVKISDLTSVTVPNAWIKKPEYAIELGQRLLDVMPNCVVEAKQQGGTWRNIDFHTYAPDLIEELDRLHIEALGIEVEPLLTHLKIMRSSSSWDFGDTV